MLVGGTVLITWLVYLPLGRWLLVSVYEADEAILPDALSYLRIKTLGEWSVEYPLRSTDISSPIHQSPP